MQRKGGGTRSIGGFTWLPIDKKSILHKQTHALKTDQISPMWCANQISSKFRKFLPSRLFFGKFLIGN